MQPLWAEMSIEPILNKVTLELQAEQWVTTTTALVNVGIDIASTDKGIEAIQTQILEKLKNLSDKGEWHVLSYDRQEDRSGLEAIQIIAQARLPQSALSAIRDKAKTISNPGQKFTISSIEFTPSDDEIRQATIKLRSEIYAQVTAEIESLDKKYPDQKFFMHQINFSVSTPMPVMMAMSAKASRSAEAVPVTVGNRQSLRATVLLAAWPEQITQKIIRNVI